MKSVFRKSFFWAMMIIVAITGCSKDDNSETIHFQVYNRDGTPYVGSLNVVGIPSASAASFVDPDGFPSSTVQVPDYPWEISGKVHGGMMAINFPNGKLNLSSAYKRNDGWTIGQVHIEQKNNKSLKIGLHKIDDNMIGSVYIFYANNDFSNGQITLKSGWNFIESIQNPNWFYGSDESFYVFGMTTQNINVFLEKGYCWQIEFWD